MEPVITDDNYRDQLQMLVGGHLVRRGLARRDYGRYPAGYYSTSDAWEPDSMPLIPRDQWPDLIADMERTKSRLSDIRDDYGIKSLDQNGQGFCWAYSSTMCVMLLRAAAGMPYVRLSPHAVACKIYNHRDRGAWGALSMDFIAKNGVPSDEFWPQASMSRSHDTTETWENAAQHRVTEGWLDMDVEAYDAFLNFDQTMTCLLSRIPVVLDYNWWGHSVCGMDPVYQDGQFGIRIINSWSDNWGERGAGVLLGSRAIPNGGCCARVPIAN